MEEVQKKRRKFGEHLTSVDIFKKFILPEVSNDVYRYCWVDLFCGEGNLVLPILELISKEKRVEFFKDHIFLFDIQREMIDKTIFNAVRYGIPENIATRNIIQRDTIKNYPTFILSGKYPIYHITNPPYLYVGYINKHKETQQYREYFQGYKEGYQDLYQLALLNDLQNSVTKMAYIIPSNFLFGFSVSNKIRDNIFQLYNIKKAFIFEKKIFEFTGVNVVICFLERKEIPRRERIIFEGIKINKESKKRTYILDPDNHFRAGNEFDEFVKRYKSYKPVKINYYLTKDEIERSKGNNLIEVINANAFDGKQYKKEKIFVNNQLYKKVKSNILYLRTVDTGSPEGRVGLYLIRDCFNVDAILVSKEKYRTHPIQVFFTTELSIDDQLLLKDYFNLLLEYFRKITDSEFMTTYKYSNSEYTRKYLGLSQARELIETFPALSLNKEEWERFKKLIKNKDIENIISTVKINNAPRELTIWG